MRENYNHKLYRNAVSAEKIGYMPKGGNLINASVLENILMGNPNATAFEIRAVSKIACLDEFIDDLPDGYDTIVGNDSDVRLTGSQRTRISLAGLLLKRCPVYILEEFSSSLDKKLEERILNNLKRIDSSTFFITYRDKAEEKCLRFVSCSH